MITIALLRAVGVSESLIAKVAELNEADEQERLALRREESRIRSREYRARKSSKINDTVTSVTVTERDGRDEVKNTSKINGSVTSVTVTPVTGGSFFLKEVSKKEATSEESKDSSSVASSLSLETARTRVAMAVPESDWPPNYRELFWTQYPNKIGKPRALQKLDRVRTNGKVSWHEFKAGLDAYCAKTDDRPWCNPETWINQERWADQPAARPRADRAGNRVLPFEHPDFWKQALA